MANIAQLNTLTERSGQDKTPMPHQELIASTPLPAILEGSETGAGKSISAITFAVNKGSLFNVVLCVKAARTQFRDEITSQQAGITHIIDRKAHNRPTFGYLKAMAKRKMPIWIISNPAILLHDDSMNYLKFAANLMGDSTLILDESHQYKNYGAKRTKMALHHSQSFKYRALLSATPYERLITDLYPQLSILYPERYPMTYSAMSNFEYNYTTYDYWNGKRKNRDDAHELIQDEIKDFYFNFKKHDLRDDMPDKHMHIIEVEAPSNVEVLANKIRTYQGFPHIEELPDGRKVEFLVPNQLSLVAHLKKLASVWGQKKEWLYENVTDATVDNPVFIACEYKDTAREIAKHYGVRPIIGSMDITDKDKYAAVVVGTVAKMKQSISLEHISRMYVISPNYGSITFRQLTERIFRINSKKDVHVHYLISSIDIDPDIYAICQEKLDDVAIWAKISDQMNERYGIFNKEEDEAVQINLESLTIKSHMNYNGIWVNVYESDETPNSFSNVDTMYKKVETIEKRIVYGTKDDDGNESFIALTKQLVNDEEE